ncbi:zinc finger MYND domain-containing protein 12, partial [Aplysia californica]|uniref:Zinc finger MYND domain-containing protein 12 n=1 Tax=Aplysia californica TaxID=6500 RepID=A0ABM1AFG5_APLCA
MILKEALMQRAQEVSINMMGENDKEQAYLAANFRVKTTIDMYGSGHPATWTGLILLASTYINLRDYSKAGSCLSKIQASLLDQDIKCPLELGAELSRVYGLIAEGQGCLDDALTEFSEEVYSNSKVHGTHGWKTAGSYWRLGRTFLHKGLHDVADSMYRQTVDIWLTYLRDKLLTNDEEKDVAAGVGGLFQKVKVEILDGEAKVQCSEALT